jgi:type I restriction enzyme S subunit
VTHDLAVEPFLRGAPKHWRAEPFRRHAKLVEETNAASSMDLLSLRSADGLVAPRTEDGGLGRQAPSEGTITRYWAARPGDLIVNPMWLIGGGIGVADVAGAVSPDYRVYKLGPRLHPRYLHHLLRSRPYIDQYRLYTRADTTFDRRVSKDNFHPMPILVPPLEEQRRIADFLDAETARIDSLIALRHKQAEIVGERITQVVDGVTAGDVGTIREIGVAESSEDWVAGKLSRLCEVVPGFAFSSSGFLTGEAGVRLLRGINIAPGAISWGEVVRWDSGLFPVPERFHLCVGDLVVGMDRPWISNGMRISFVAETDLPALLLQRVACLRPKSAVVMSYVYWALSSTHFRLSVESELTGVSVPHLSGEQIGSFAFRLPPNELQQSISEALDRQVDETRRMKAAISRQINLLTERRAALIATAVTGQIDVSTASGRGIED